MIIYDGKLPKKPITPGQTPLSYFAGLGSALSSAVESTTKYTTNTLNSVSNKVKDATDQAQSQADIMNAVREEEDKDFTTPAEKDEMSNLRKNKGKFSLPMVFKIVPIGLNIIAKGPTLVSGATDVMMGLKKALVNTVVSIADLFKSLLSFSVEGFKFSFVLLICFLENMSNFNSCVIFYFIDICLIIVYLLLFSFLSLLDALFFEKLFGIGLVEIVTMGFSAIYEIDEMIFKASGLHVLAYPKCIQKMCYTCSVKSNHKQVASTGGNLLNAITSRIPKRQAEPIHKFISAGKKFASVFKI